MQPIPYGRQHVTDDDVQAVIDVLKADYLTQGPKVSAFENAFSDYIGSKYAVAVSNGTAALHLCALALKVAEGQKVITSPITFVASANCVAYCGGEIDFVDIDPETYLMDLDKLEEKLQDAKPGEYSGIIPVDFAGYPVDLERLKKIADKHNLWIIEDACHAPGGYFINLDGEKENCGNGKYADAAIFSFHPVKHIASGEGGMITTNNEDLYKKLLFLRTHGITKEEHLMSANHGGWYYEMIDLGYNYRLTDIQCALGMSQLKRADKNIKIRNQIANNYIQAFQNTDFKLQKIKENIYHAYHLFIIQTDKRKQLYDYLRKNNVYTQVHYIPVHLQPFYRNKGYKKGDFPIAETYYEKCLSLPLYPTLKEEEQAFVIDNINNFYEGK
jgi:UDP-4-amino-4,6-dideoxy-N-acetyl-beta-L-altrosamine transaminase